MLSCQPQHVHFPKICIFGKCAEKEVFKDSPYFSSEVACVAACCSVLQCIAVCCCVLKDSSYFASEVGKRDRFIDEKRVGSNGCSSWYGNDSFICVTWLIHMCDMTHSYVWHDSSNGCSSLYGNDSFICVTWLIHMCDMTHPMDLVCCMWKHFAARTPCAFLFGAVCCSVFQSVAVCSSMLQCDSLCFPLWAIRDTLRLGGGLDE